MDFRRRRWCFNHNKGLLFYERHDVIERSECVEVGEQTGQY